MQLTQDDKMNLYFTLLESQAHAEYDRKTQLDLGMDLKGSKKRLDRVNDLVSKFEIELFGKTI
jgi:hypothetical protein